MKIHFSSRDETGLSFANFELTTGSKDFNLIREGKKNYWRLSCDVGNQNRLQIILNDYELGQLRRILDK